VTTSVEPDDVVAARATLAPMIRQTPLLESSALSALVGGPVYLKCENLQRGGSFKVRGAYVRIARLTAAERARGVVAASAGNHAQGVALAAGELDAELGYGYDHSDATQEARGISRGGTRSGWSSSGWSSP